jgi:hypothetical protein
MTWSNEATVASFHLLRTSAGWDGRSWASELKLEGERAAFAPVNRDALDRRSGLQGLAALQFLPGPGFNPGDAGWQVDGTSDDALLNSSIRCLLRVGG